ncbi:hypothetical protein [Faecalicoccus pleomorphus]|uniref:hypothetical protein n=1 Tax=Faecalicoccus pleomorphus TaxID=1323 RepID=UPI0022E05620|nr:hypothetical protein [Faecalicoccus pleomorphus]
MRISQADKLKALIEANERKLQELRARHREAVKKEQAQHRRWETEWKKTVGSFFLNTFDFDWTHINLAALQKYMTDHKDEMSAAVYTDEHPTPEQAYDVWKGKPAGKVTEAESDQAANGESTYGEENY